MRVCVCVCWVLGGVGFWNSGVQSSVLERLKVLGRFSFLNIFVQTRPRRLEV